MKILKLPLAVLLLFAISACQKNTTSVTSAVTGDEAASMVSASLATNSNGLVGLSATDITVHSQAMINLNLNCGATKTYTIARQSPTGATTSFNYALNYNYTLNCNSNGVADNITGTVSNKGSFENSTFASTNTGTGTFRVAGFSPTALGYVINAEYKLSGTFNSKVGEKHYTSSTVTISVVNLVINKTTGLVTSGSATVTASGSTTTSTFNFTGALIFNANGTAKLTLNGISYNIDLITGVVTKA